MTGTGAEIAEYQHVAGPQLKASGDLNLLAVASPAPEPPSASSGQESPIKRMMDVAPDAFFAAMGTENFFNTLHQPRIPHSHGKPDLTINDGPEAGTMIWHQTDHGHREITTFKLKTGPVYTFKYAKDGHLKQVVEPDGTKMDLKENNEWNRWSRADKKASATYFGTVVPLDAGMIRYHGDNDTERIINGNGFTAETFKMDGKDVLKSVSDSSGRKVEFSYVGAELNAIQISDNGGLKFNLIRDPDSGKWFQNVPGDSSQFPLPYGVTTGGDGSVTVENLRTGRAEIFSITGKRTEQRKASFVDTP